MKKLTFSLGVAALAVLAFVATVAAADPSPTPARDQLRDRDTIPAILGLSQTEVMELRHDGLSLAQIAERQKVDPQKLIDALVAQWTERIDARVANGALTASEATALKADLETRAKAMVSQTTLGGMHGAAVGAGPGANGAGNGFGPGFGGMGAGMAGRMGDGTCDGSGPHGRGGR